MEKKTSNGSFLSYLKLILETEWKELQLLNSWIVQGHYGEIYSAFTSINELKKE